MLSRAAHSRNAFKSLIVDGKLKSSLVPTDDEWENLRTVLNLLYPFKADQKVLECKTCVAASFVPACIRKCGKSMDKILEENTREAKLLAETMKADFESRWGTPDSPYWKVMVLVKLGCNANL